MSSSPPELTDHLGNLGNASDDFSSNTGSSYSLILEHVLQYPGTYEIPLRTMYTLNSTPRAQPSRPSTPSGSRGPLPSPLQSNFPPTPTQTATAQFQSHLANHITQLPSQPCSLPPVFISTFVRRCFPPDLFMVDFPQALTALDYLKDLETRRRREVAASLQRLGIDKSFLEAASSASLKQQPETEAWLSEMNTSERKIETYYTQLYIALRRWILINELSLIPFNKHNCLAMLNTLYPPLPNLPNQPTPAQPTAMLTPELLRQQRDGFFSWIRRVEAKGPSVLEPLMQQGKRTTGGHNDPNGWPAVRDTLDVYLRVANKVIDDCQSIKDQSELEQMGHRSKGSSGSEESTARLGRKADSGVSFSSSNGDVNRRPGTSEGDRKVSASPSPLSEHQAHFPYTPRTDSLTDSLASRRGKGTTLEKLARELKKMTAPRSPTAPSSQSARLPPPPRPSSAMKKTHLRQHSDESMATQRPPSRGAAFIRSLSRPRSRSRARTPAPPTPTVAAFVEPTSPPPEVSNFDDSSDDENGGGDRGRGRGRRSFGFSRPNVPSARSSSRGASVLRKLRGAPEAKQNDVETRGRGREHTESDGFDPEEMKRQREAWEKRVREHEAKMHGIGEAV